jgi:hypothetical protein
MRWLLAALSGLGLLLGPDMAAAEILVHVRTGQHPGFGRIVLEPSGGVVLAHRVEQSGDRLMLRFAAPTRFDLRAARWLPRGMADIAMEGDGLAIALRPSDAALRQLLIGNRIVLDVIDPPRQGRQEMAVAAQARGQVQPPGLTWTGRGPTPAMPATPAADPTGGRLCLVALMPDDDVSIISLKEYSDTIEIQDQLLQIGCDLGDILQIQARTKFSWHDTSFIKARFCDFRYRMDTQAVSDREFSLICVIGSVSGRRPR